MDIEKVLETVEVTPEPETPQEAPVEAAAPQEAAPVPESPSSKHFKAVRELKERAERERDDALRKAADLEARLANNQPEEDNTINLASDELAEGKHLNKVDRKIKKLEEQLNSYKQQSAASLVEARLKMEYPDIEKVVTKENIEVLGIQYPSLAATIKSSSDLYNQAVAAYTLIKKFGIQPEDTYSEDRLRAQTNAAKPRPLTSVSPQQGSPLSHANAFANGLTDELKAQLYKEMMESIR